jgi:BASS family bile acid:Na+ symporter
MVDRFLSVFRAVLERLLLVWLVLLCVAAFDWPRWLPEVADPFLAWESLNKYVFAVTMLAIGSLLPQEEVRELARRWPTIIGGTAVQFVSMPLLAYLAGRAFGLEGAALQGVVLVGCVPGAMASNVLTLAARGNVSYSVSLTTSATLLSPLLVPAMLGLYLGASVSHEKLLQIMIRLTWMVVVPVVVGYLLSRCSQPWRAAAKRLGSIVANLTILWIIAVVVAQSRHELSQMEMTLLWALVVVNLGGYLAGTAGGFLLRLPRPMRRALTLEIGMQNAGIGAVLAGDFFSPGAAVAPAFYTFGCMLTGTVLARIWGELARRGNGDSGGDA